MWTWLPSLSLVFVLSSPASRFPSGPPLAPKTGARPSIISLFFAEKERETQTEDWDRHLNTASLSLSLSLPVYIALSQPRKFLHNVL